MTIKFDSSTFKCITLTIFNSTGVCCLLLSIFIFGLISFGSRRRRRRRRRRSWSSQRPTNLNGNVPFVVRVYCTNRFELLKSYKIMVSIFGHLTPSTCVFASLFDQIFFFIDSIVHTLHIYNVERFQSNDLLFQDGQI